MLQVVTRQDALQIIKENTTQILAVESVPLQESLGRTLAEDIVSVENVPSFNRTTVDGYAVKAADTFGATDAAPAQLEIIGEIHMGEHAAFPLKSGQCAKISTGGMLPTGADAAVMVEHTDTADNLCLVYKSVAPFENITTKGDDILSGTTALKRGTRITTAETGVLAALGIMEVPVFKMPVIAILSTGDEIVSGAPQPGQIRDVNTHLLTAAATARGCTVLPYGAVKDERETILAALKECINKADIVLISGGSSAGTKDMTVDILDTLGKVYFHGIAMKPGKPTIFGKVQGKPVFGLPGHPLAAYFVFRLIVGEYIRFLTGAPAEKPTNRARLALNIPSNHGREEFLCVTYNETGELVPVHTKSGIISVLCEAQGFIGIDRNSEGVEKGTKVEVYKL